MLQQQQLQHAQLLPLLPPAMLSSHKRACARATPLDVLCSL